MRARKELTICAMTSFGENDNFSNRINAFLMSRVRYYGVTICLTILTSALLSSRQSDWFLTVLEKVKSYHESHGQEKIYLHFDKPFYAAGENMWFKAYLVEASLHHL